MSETHSTQPITGLNVLLCVDNTASMLRGRFTVSSTLIPDPATLSESDTGRALLSGYTLHDAAVHTAESLIKLLGRRQNLMCRYSLWTMGDGLQIPMTEDALQIQNALRMLPRPSALPRMDIGLLLSQIFNYLHLLRMEGYMDQFSGGFYPNSHLPTIILFITGGGSLVDIHDVSGSVGDDKPPAFNIPGLTAAGCQQYFEPFRWDQRLYTILLKSASQAQQWVEQISTWVDEERWRNGAAVGYIPLKTGTGTDGKSDPDTSSIEYWLDKMATEMNGQLVTVTCQFSLNRCLEYLAGLTGRPHRRDPASIMPAALRSFFPTGVSITFFSPAVANRWEETRENRVVMITDVAGGFSKIGQSMDSMTLKAFGYWPIPESWYLEPSRHHIPKRRSCRPEIKFVRQSGTDWSTKIPSGLVSKKYLLDPNMELSKQIMSEPDGTCWLCYAPGSNGSGAPTDGYPFGFIRTKNDRKGVNLWVLPYNFPVLFSLLETSKHKRRSSEWLQGFHAYVNSCPFYYSAPLKRALSASVIGIPSKAITMIDALAAGCNPQAFENLKQMHLQADKQLQSLLEVLTKQETVFPSDRLKQDLLVKPLPSNAFDIPRNQLILTWRQMNFKFFADEAPKVPMASLSKLLTRGRSDIQDMATDVLFPAANNITCTASSIKSVLNRWCIPTVHPKLVGPRTEEQKKQDKLHLISVAKAGDYTEKMNANQRLRFISEEDEFRYQKLAFGNPFKRLKFTPGDLQDSSVQLETPLSEIEREAINSLSSRDRTENGTAIGATNTSIIWKRGHPQHSTPSHGGRSPDPSSLEHQLRIHRLSYLTKIPFDQSNNSSHENIRKAFDQAMNKYKTDLQRARMEDEKRPIISDEVKSIAPSEDYEDTDYESQGQYNQDESDSLPISVDNETENSKPSTAKRSLDDYENDSDSSTASIEPSLKKRPFCPPTPVSNASSDSEPEISKPKITRPEAPVTAPRSLASKLSTASSSGINMKRYISMIRNPGRTQDKVLLKELHDLDVIPDQKRQICQELITEAKRFKKSALISDLEAFVKNM